MCTHTSSSSESDNNWHPTDREFFEFFTSEKAYVVQHWRRRDDFFFCHWIAESEDDILELLDKTSMSNTIVTMANEMHRFITTYDIKDEKIIMHDEM
jgi:hypothetical protein